MNKVLGVVLLLLFGCNQNRPENKLEDKMAIDRESMRLEGVWLSDYYLSSIEVSRSVYESRKYNAKFWGFVLDKNNLMSDSAALNGFTEHEGGYFCYLNYDTGKNVFEHDLNKDTEFSYLKGVPFELGLVDSIRLELKTEREKEMYRKVSGEQTALRDILFAGKYQDLKKENGVIEFKNDGQISGVENRRYFDIVFDFGEGIEYDACTFYTHIDSSRLGTNGDMYHYKINADTLRLFKLHTNWSEMNHKIGDLEYLLKKL
jgi:hypothetical protein